ncbi:MAG TPA: hypothetical protein VNA11_13690 [Pseudonocardia sp.]|nr:hypothetical protein [Pseudonocardia sp.]
MTSPALGAGHAPFTVRAEVRAPESVLRVLGYREALEHGWWTGHR